MAAPLGLPLEAAWPLAASAMGAGEAVEDAAAAEDGVALIVGVEVGAVEEVGDEVGEAVVEGEAPVEMVGDGEGVADGAVCTIMSGPVVRVLQLEPVNPMSQLHSPTLPPLAFSTHIPFPEHPVPQDTCVAHSLPSQPLSHSHTPPRVGDGSLTHFPCAPQPSLPSPPVQEQEMSLQVTPPQESEHEQLCPATAAVSTVQFPWRLQKLRLEQRGLEQSRDPQPRTQEQVEGEAP